jgi:ABC-type uncharacterized transport system substrate-binding protein
MSPTQRWCGSGPTLSSSPKGFFTSRRASNCDSRRIIACPQGEFVEVGGLISYGSDISDVCRQVGVYTGQILKGAEPAEADITMLNRMVVI